MTLKHCNLVRKSNKPYTADQLKIEKVDECYQKPLKMLVETIQSILEVIPSSDPNLFIHSFNKFTYARMHSIPGGVKQHLHSDYSPVGEGNLL
jgi:hypothetical protein